MNYAYTIEVEDEEAIEKLKSIAAENGIDISVKRKEKIQKSKKSGELLAAALNEVALKGGLPSFGDASEWQRQQRKDRNLTGRED